MDTITAKCPACGAMHTHLREAADDTATCAKCGAIYIPSECAVDAAAMAHEAAADAARYARQSEALLRQIAQDARRAANCAATLRTIAVVMIIVDILAAIFGR